MYGRILTSVVCTDLTAFGLTHDFCKDSPIQTCCWVNKNLLTVLYIFDRIVVSKGHCNFQSGLCGLKPDKNGNFHWTVGSGQTPTESTGPSYDHTSLNMDGKTRQNRQKLLIGTLKLASICSVIVILNQCK